jgi:hypothetical protein
MAISNVDSTVVWTADLPTQSYDCYIGVRVVDGILLAKSSNSYVCAIDISSGAILNKRIVW